MFLIYVPLHFCLSPWYPIQVIDREPDNFLTLMDDNGDTKADLKVADDVGEQIQGKLDNDETIMVGMMIIMTTVITNVTNKLILHVHFRLFKVFTESF